MLHTNNPVIKHKAGLLNLAEELSKKRREPSPSAGGEERRKSPKGFKGQSGVA